MPSKREQFKARHLETREKSVCIEHNGTKAFIPRSQIESMDIQGDSITLNIPTWLYNEKFNDNDE